MLLTFFFFRFLSLFLSIDVTAADVFSSFPLFSFNSECKQLQREIRPEKFSTRKHRNINKIAEVPVVLRQSLFRWYLVFVIVLNRMPEAVFFVSSSTRLKYRRCKNRKILM